MRRTRSRVVSLLAAVALASVACSTSDPADDDAGGGGEAEENDGQGGTRTIEHALGTTEVPLDAERIVVGRRGPLPVLLDLGVEPVGSYDATELIGQPFHPLITDRVEAAGVEPIPAEDFQMQLEPIAALEPDLIISASVDIEATYDQLSQIAPTVALDFDFDEPLNNVVPIGEVVGREEQAHELVEEFEADVEDAGEGLDDPGTVSIVARFGPDDLRLYRSGNLVGQLVEELGGEVVPTEDELALDADNPLNNVISEEQLTLASGERLIVFANPGEAGDAEVASLEEVPTYQRLPAVQSGAVLRMDVQLPFFTAGLEGVREALDELVAFLGDDQ